MFRSLPRPATKDGITAAQIREHADLLEWLLKCTVAPPLGLVDDATGRHFSIDLLPSLWMRVTDQPLGENYPWVEVRENAVGQMEDYPSGQSGTMTINPAREVNGNLNVPTNVILRAWPDLDRDGYHFHYVPDITEGDWTFVGDTWSFSDFTFNIDSTAFNFYGGSSLVIGNTAFLYIQAGGSLIIEAGSVFELNRHHPC